MTTALVPVKHLAESKSRLLPELAREQLEALCLSMLADVVEALVGTRAIERVAVVTPDAAVADAAEALGVRGLVIETPGLNPSIDAAARRLQLGAEEALLVVLGDVAGALREELQELHDTADALPRPSVVLAPSSDGGTSALLRTPHDAIPSRFGRDSARHHREEAERRGLVYREVELPSLAIDLDRSDDVQRFLAGAAGGPRTRALLEELAWGQPGGPGAPLHREAP